MPKRKPDDLSLALFHGTDVSGSEDHPPGLTEVQKIAASASERAMVLNQPMQSIALRPTHGAITRNMSLLWLKIIQEIQQQPEGTIYKIPLKSLVEFIGDAKNYDRLKENLKALNAVQVEWNTISTEGEQWAVSSLLAQAKVIKVRNSATIEVSLPPDINRGVRELKQFSVLNLLLARELKNPAALSLFRIAVAYETNPSRLTFRKPPVEWESMLRGTPRQVGTEFEYKYFKRDTLLPALAEVNRLTHLTLELIEHKEGRTIKELQFRVNQKQQGDLEATPESARDAEATALLKELGVRTTEARALVASFGAERVKRNVEYLKAKQVEAPKKVRNATAYIKAAIQNDYADRDILEGDVTVVTADPTSKKGVSQLAADREIAMQSFQAHRRTQVNGLFMEMPYRESNQHWERFGEAMKKEKNQTLLSAIASKGLKAKIVQIRFYDWLADQLLEPISERSFVDFLVGQQSAGKAAASRKRATRA